MSTPVLESSEVSPLVGLWLEPWNQPPRLVEFAEMGFPDDRRQIVVGRSRCCHVAVDSDEVVSNEHWKIEARGDELWIVDMGSTNGTLVNLVPLDDGEVRLRDGFTIKFGRSLATVLGPEKRLSVEGATYSSWMSNAAKKHGSLRAAEDKIHRGRSTIHNALRRRQARDRRIEQKD